MDGVIESVVFEPLNDSVFIRPDVVVEDAGALKTRYVDRALGKSGVVVQVGPDASDVQIGDAVVFDEDTGVEVNVGDEKLISLGEGDILCVV